MDAELFGMTLGNILTFAAIAIGFIYQGYAANRDRKWTQEDNVQKAQELTAKVAADAAVIAEKMKEDAIALAVKNSAETAEIAATLAVKVEESIKASSLALKEANNFHVKLQEFNGQLGIVTGQVKSLIEQLLPSPKKSRKKKKS